MDKKRILFMSLTVLSIIVGVVLFTIHSGGFTWDAIVIIIIVLLFLAYAIPRFILNRHDKVDNDEYSKKVLRTAAARSYYISLYTWLAMIWFAKPLDDFIPETTTKFTQRDEKQFEEIAKIYTNITNTIDGNSAIFLPSYFLMDKVNRYFADMSNKRIIREVPGLSKEGKHDLLEISHLSFFIPIKNFP